MDSYGTLTIYAYTSDARLPVEGAKVTILRSLDANAEVIATAVTDRSGYIAPVIIPTPSSSQSQSPDQSTPFATVGITITHPDYETEKIRNVQVFPNTITVQSFRLIPTNPQYPNGSLDFNTPPQNL